MKYFKGWSTHIPMLVKAVQITEGPVAELGSGPFSTPLLHWLLAESGRKLVTFEGKKNYFKAAKGFQSRNHSIRFVENWDDVDFGKDRWSVALIDHELERRSIEPIRLKNSVDYIVMHDTEHPIYGYDKVFPHFKYVHHWKFCKPWTSVVSNFKKLDAFSQSMQEEEKTISRLLNDYCTDKNLNTKHAHCYGLVYDALFKSFDRNEKLDIVEIGTDRGESLLAWRKYFTNANITGIDIADRVENKRSDIEYIFSDVKSLFPKKRYDIVIDDGSHKLTDVIHTVKNFKLKPGGIMIIEDCQAPNHWFEKIRKITSYSVETIDLRSVNNRRDDFLIVLRNYGYRR